jgi:hypothetical protein
MALPPSDRATTTRLRWVLFRGDRWRLRDAASGSASMVSLVRILNVSVACHDATLVTVRQRTTNGALLRHQPRPRRVKPLAASVTAMSAGQVHDAVLMLRLPSMVFHHCG